MAAVAPRTAGRGVRRGRRHPRRRLRRHRVPADDHGADRRAASACPRSGCCWTTAAAGCSSWPPPTRRPGCSSCSSSSTTRARAWTPSRSGTPVVNADLAHAAADGRPSPRAPPASGFRSVHALPLRLRVEVIGALNLFGTDTGALDAGRRAGRPGARRRRDDRAAAGEGDPARRGPHRAAPARAEQPGRHRAGQGRAGPHPRDRTSTPPSSCCAAYARNNNRKLVDLARAVVTEPHTLPGLMR